MLRRRVQPGGGAGAPLPPPTRGRREGVTLAELLTVLVIIALISSLGAGAYQAARRNYSFQASASEIATILRTARNSALDSGGAAFVVVDPTQRTVTAHTLNPVGEWAFEGDGGGPLRFSSGKVAGGSSVAGHLGNGMDFSGGGHIDCGSQARYDLRTGLFIEAWVRRAVTTGEENWRVGRTKVLGQKRTPRMTRTSRAASRSKRTRPVVAADRTKETAGVIVGKRGAYGFGMTPSGYLEATIGEYTARTIERVVPAERWVHVTMYYVSSMLEVSVDGVPRPLVPTVVALDKKKIKPPAAIPVNTKPLTISAPDRPLPGRIDEVRLAGAVEPDVYEYDEFQGIVGWKKLVHFDRRGRLDARHHVDGVRIVLYERGDVQGATGKTAVAVDYSVTFDEFAARWKERPPDLNQRNEETKIEAAVQNAQKIVITVDKLGTIR